MYPEIVRELDRKLSQVAAQFRSLAKSEEELAMYTVVLKFLYVDLFGRDKSIPVFAQIVMDPKFANFALVKREV